MRGNQNSTVRAIRGPVTLITLGVLFACQNFTPYGFDQTWPVLLIVFGALSLLGRATAPPLPPQPPQGPPYAPPYAQPYAWQPPSASGGQGTPYSQSPYAQPAPDAAGPAKGGFGTSAPPRNPGTENSPEGSTPGGGL